MLRTSRKSSGRSRSRRVTTAIASIAIQRGKRAAGRRQRVDQALHGALAAHQGQPVGELGLHADLGGRRKRVVARHQHVDQRGKLGRQRLRLSHLAALLTHPAPRSF